MCCCCQVFRLLFSNGNATSNSNNGPWDSHRGRQGSFQFRLLEDGVNNKKLYTSSGGEYHSLEVYITFLNLQLANLIGQIVTTMVQMSLRRLVKLPLLVHCTCRAFLAPPLREARVGTCRPTPTPPLLGWARACNPNSSVLTWFNYH